MGNHYEKKLLKEMWFKMNLAREFENRVQWLFSMGLVHGTTHLGVGEEATAVVDSGIAATGLCIWNTSRAQPGNFKRNKT